MIYITGDCHGDFHRFKSIYFEESKEMSKEDTVIICGDFGLWDNSQYQENSLDFLEKLPFTVLWVSGNHENYDLLKEYPIESWNGGKVQFIRPHVIHLMRGQIFHIEDCTFFTFGGASSHDIRDGILELDDPNYKKKKKELDRRKALYRINHLSWWKEELPTKEEMDEGILNLNKVNNQVDFIVSHCCATSTQVLLSSNYKPDILTDYFESIKYKVKYKKWFFGHYHDNKMVSDKEILIYEQIIRIR